MTVTEPTNHPAAQVPTVDLYRDPHKGIRAELFAVTAEAGRLDPHSEPSRLALGAHVRSVVGLLEEHSKHEDIAIQPALEAHLPDLAARIETDHALLSGRTARLVSMVDAVAEATSRPCAEAVHTLYLELADFTGIYLAHQDVEERDVMPALEEAVGTEAVRNIHAVTVSSIPPARTAQWLAVMLPAMNLDNRAEMLGGMHSSAPPQIFEGIWGLVGTLLDPADVAAVSRRIGL